MSASALSAGYFAKLPTERLIAARELVSDILDFRARQISIFDSPAPAPVLVKPAAVEASSYVPSVLSPSSVACFSECSAKWYYRKVLQLPETRTAALALGSAVHEALAVNFGQKVTTGCDIPAEGIVMVFRDSFASQLADNVELAEGEKADDLANCGDSMIRVYMDQAAPSIQPAAVELSVEGLIGDVPVHGFVDLLTVDGDVIDVKTAAKKPSGVSAAHRLQVSTYAMLTPGASGRGRVDTLTKTKTTALHSTSLEVGAADRKLTERLYSITRDQMAAGLIIPNRGSYMCSRKHCSFADECVRSFGGEVA